MPDERPLTSQQADQPRTDFAAIESNLEFIMGQLAQVPTRKQLALLFAGDGRNGTEYRFRLIRKSN
jgi:hypothetical protein